ncbi:MAG TPA: hypothetical protein VGJ21_01690 [Terracidiphilus sp.]|jgi:hypothetical protein
MKRPHRSPAAPPVSKYPLVLVKWIDPGSIDAWTPAEEMTLEPIACVTAGFLMRETECALYVSASRNGDDGCCTMVIPQVCVTARHTIAPAAEWELVEEPGQE